MQETDFDAEVDQLTYEEPKMGIPKNNSVSIYSITDIRFHLPVYYCSL